jgi:hypothetical protein
MILMPAMDHAQQAGWHSLLDLYELQPDGWTLIGGQLVHLLCAERGYPPQRPTSDADAVVNARVPEILGAVTSALLNLDFEPDPSSDGVQHRWKRGDAIIDVLIPEGTGARTEARKSASGFPTVAAPGGTQGVGPVRGGSSCRRRTLWPCAAAGPAQRHDLEGCGTNRNNRSGPRPALPRLCSTCLGARRIRHRANPVDQERLPTTWQNDRGDALDTGGAARKPGGRPTANTTRARPGRCG